MKDKKINVFIQNLSDTTTVLQQLRLCIEEIKKAINLIDSADLETFAEDVVAMNLRLDNISEDVDELKEDVADKELYEHRITIRGADYKVYLTVYSNVSSYSDIYDFLGNKRYACSGCYNDEGDRDYIIAVGVTPDADTIRMYYNNYDGYHIISADDVIFDDSVTKIF